MRLVRILIYLLIGFVALGVIRYQQLTHDHYQSQAKVVPIKPSAAIPPETLRLPYAIHRLPAASTNSDLTPRSALAQLRAQYRLPPDRRFILALLELQKLLVPDMATDMKIRFLDGSWGVYLNGELVAQIGEFPSFAEARKMLLTVSKKLLPSLKIFTGRQANARAQHRGGFSPLDAQQRLRELNQHWQNGDRDFAAVRQAADALSRMSWAVSDLLEDQDIIMARAFALTVLAERGLDLLLPREESILAEAMGYHSHAQDMAEQLEQSDPWRLYILEQPALLAQKAQTAADRDSVDLWLMQLARDDKAQEWSDWFKQHYRQESAPIYALRTAYSLRGFYPRTIAIRMMPIMITAANADSRQDQDKWSALSSNVANYFPLGRVAILTRLISRLLADDSSIKPDHVMNSINIAAEKFSGPFLDHHIYQTYYQGIYFTSLYRLGLHYLYSRSDLDQAASFDQYMGASNHPGIVELSTWYTNLLNANQNKIEMDALLQDLREAKYIGIATLENTLDELLPRYSFGSPKIIAAVNFLFSRLDSRIAHRFILASLSREYLLHLSLGEKLYNSIHRDEARNRRGLSAWLGRYHNQAAQVIEVVSDKTVSPDIRSKAAKLLTSMEPPPPQTETLLQQLIEEHPGNWKAHDTYIRYLEHLRKYDSAMAVASNWLEQANEKSNSFDYWKAVIAVSRQHVSMGDPDAAWNIISTITDSWFGGALYQATKIKLAQGDIDGAYTWAQRAIERYPTSIDAITDMACVLWQQRDFDKAARFLSEHRQYISTEDWRWKIGSHFADTFASNTDEIRPAFFALQKAGLGYAELMYIPRSLAWRNLFRQAFNTQTELKLNGGAQIQIYVDAYRYLEKAEGREAAIKWLAGRIPGKMRNFAGMIFFGEKQYSLLWDLIPEPESGQFPDAVWLYRAAALAQNSPLSTERKSQLLNYYQRHRNSKYDKLGRFVLGLSDGSELLDLAMDERTLSETAFYLGMAALKKNHLSEATDWLKLSTHYSSTRNGEYRWSYDRLYRWKETGQSLQVLATTGKLISLPE